MENDHSSRSVDKLPEDLIKAEDETALNTATLWSDSFGENSQVPAAILARSYLRVYKELIKLSGPPSVIFTDRASILNYYKRQFPDEKPIDVTLNNSNSGPIYWITETSQCEDRKPCELHQDTERWNYFGLEVGIYRWRTKLAKDQPK